MLESLVGSFTGPVLESLGAKVGIPSSVVKSFAPMATALVVGALGRKLKGGGVEAVTDLLGQAGKFNIDAKDPTAFIKDVKASDTSDLLKSLAGGADLNQVVANVAGKSGIDAKAVGGLLSAIAPMALSGIAGFAKSNQLAGADLGKLVEGAVGDLPDAGAIDYLIDNVPGVSDDISRALKGLFG
jgi:hypothetical protein